MKYRKKIAFLFALLAIASYLSFLTSNHQSEVVKVSNERLDYLPVYLLDQDDLLIPLSIPIENDLTWNQKIEHMFAYLSGKQQIKGYKPLFQKALQPVKIALKQNILHLYFDQNFLNYDESLELSVLEAIVYSATALKEVNEVKLYYQNELLAYMPKTRIKLQEHLTRKIGINHFESIASLHDSYMVTMYYKKDDKIVAKSIRVNEMIDSVEKYIKYLLKDISISSLLSQPLVKNEILINEVSCNQQVCSIDVNHNMLDSDQSIKDDLLMILKIALKDQGIKQIKLKVNGKLVKDENIDQNMIYNVVDFE